jgi:hypothetical protein
MLFSLEGCYYAFAGSARRIADSSKTATSLGFAFFFLGRLADLFYFHWLLGQDMTPNTIDILYCGTIHIFLL